MSTNDNKLTIRGATLSYVRTGAVSGNGDYLDAEERERLHASIDRELDDIEAGRTVDAYEVIAELRARSQ